MPKLIIVFHGAESPASALAEAAAEGARAVRFSEVDVRAAASHELTTGRRYKSIDSAAQLADYDGVVLAAPAAGDIPVELSRLLDQLERADERAFANTVFAVIGGDNTTLFGRVARLGGIIVSESRGIDDPVLRAKATGGRAATVVSWIRHAMSHEHAHASAHSHSHEHAHSDEPEEADYPIHQHHDPHDIEHEHAHREERAHEHDDR